MSNRINHFAEKSKRPVFPFLILFVFFVLFSSQHCASVYMKNRERDAADIFTLTVSSKNVGLSLRAGPLKAGLNYKSPNGKSYGLRGGTFGRLHTAEFTFLIFGADYFSAVPIRFLPKNKKNQIAAGNNDNNNEDTNESSAEESILYLRKKTFFARSPFGTKKSADSYKSLLKDKGVFVTPYYFTQIEITAGAYFGIKIGINLGELADFLLGIFTIDICDDDAPYESALIRKLKKTPYWDMLDEKAKKKIIEEGL